ncbi:unnamed protein product [Heligmosomoides polygyrus]|uniref:V-type proton ATPase subunit a n=1 Tax=Heligmosomoides polygyrus TaxID=6339 RepID=A0A183F928_HELPZ|nr:unnamed protein product [Heligmosomoides polygyrus]
MSKAATKTKFVEVDTVSWANAALLRGNRVSINRPRVLRMLQDLDEQLVDRSECYKIEFERATREKEVSSCQELATVAKAGQKYTGGVALYDQARVSLGLACTWSCPHCAICAAICEIIPRLVSLLLPFRRVYFN